MSIIYHADLIQGSDEWLEARRGLLTASEMKLILTPTLKCASNEKERSHLYELLAQRITGHVEPSYLGDDMMRGHAEEVEARILYDRHYAKVTDMGFITNDRWGFKIGYSTDGLVSTDGLIECKSRRQKFQIETIVEYAASDLIPPEFMLQVQTGLLVSERLWCDFISYSDGMPMVTVRVLPDPQIQDAIITAATAFEERLADKLIQFAGAVDSGMRLIPTQRHNRQEIRV